MKFLSIFLALVLTCCIHFELFAQANNTFFQMPQVVPSSPEPAAIMKVSDIPVDFSKGAANIDLPIYTIKEGNITVPISISYNTSGIKVQDVSGFIGLGWNLNFGGIINVKTEASEPGEQVLNSNFKQESDILSGDQSLALQFCSRVVAGTQEKQTPQYYYNLGQYSGSFYYDINNQLLINSSNQSLSITQITNGFKIITPEGIQYTFTNQQSSSGTWSMITAYLIANIVDLNSNKKVSFTYKTTAGYMLNQETQMLDYVTTPNPGANCAFASGNTSDVTTPVTYGELQIDSIKFSTGYVKFISSADRQDVDNVRITGVKVYNTSIVPVKNASFLQSYFVSTGAPTSPYNHRLRLDSLIFTDVNNSAGEKYGFTYNTTYAPAYKRSDGHNFTGVDYWGYYNGVDGNAGLIPRDVIAPSDFTNYTVPSSYLGNRKADSNYNQAFILKQIKFPTGGTAQFTYESNVVADYALGNVVGGIRVKRISYYDYPYPGSYHSKYYKYINASMPLNYSNDYSYDKQKTVICSGPSSCPSGGVCSTLYYTRNVYSEPLGTLAYLIINPFYSQVEEYDMNGEHLGPKTIYYYDTANQFWVQAIPIPEYGGEYVTQRDWLTSQLLLKTEYYKTDASGNYIIIRKVENSYTDLNEINPQIGVHVSPKAPNDFIGGDYTTLTGLIPTPSTIYTFYNAKNSHGNRVLSSRKTTDYFTADSVITTEINAYTSYNNNYFNSNNSFNYLTHKTTYTSKGDTDITSYKYPIDTKYNFFGIDPASGSAIDSLIARNTISPILETDHSTNAVVSNSSSTRTNYGVWAAVSGTYILPKTVQYQQATDALQNRLDYLNYDTYGNLTSAALEKGPPTSYQWGYNHQYTVAEAKNASTNDIFYESFEDGNGNTSINDAKTGRYSYNGIATPYSKTLSGLDAGNYTLTYWQKSGSTWSLQSQQVTVTGSSYTINASGQIDDVRFYPITAQMTTYTYDGLVGVTSTADAKGMIKYYEYDSYRRLMNIRDRDNNIIKSFCYNYANQPGNCYINLPSFTNAAQSAPYTKACSTGMGTIVNYIVPAGKYTSNISQVDADSQASADVTANGQNYANANGTCLPTTSFTLSNTTGGGYTATFTSATINPPPYTFPTTGSTPIQVPIGTFTVSVNPTSGNIVRTIGLTGQTSANAPRATFYNITISSGTTLTLSIQ